jgi:hypothetical protein
VDCDEAGDLSTLDAMRSFRIGRQYRRFSSVDHFNFSVTVYEAGDVVSICVDAGAHGTHVAGIVAAYHPVTTFRLGPRLRALTRPTRHHPFFVTLSPHPHPATPPPNQRTTTS